MVQRLRGAKSANSPEDFAEHQMVTLITVIKVEKKTVATSQLGYPAFATKNTTRIGGSEAAGDAAGAALAVFPSATAAQSPAAVTIVDEAEWRALVARSARAG